MKCKKFSPSLSSGCLMQGSTPVRSLYKVWSTVLLRRSPLQVHSCQARKYYGSFTISVCFLYNVIISSITICDSHKCFTQPNLTCWTRSDVTVICAVELSPMVNILVTVMTEWTGPAGFLTTNTAQPVMGNSMLYASTVAVSSFGRSQSGIYTCRATIGSASLNSFISDSVTSLSTRLTIGKIF